ncbi:Hypothetical predicted protein, partial [Olea europaea subsp. europaea]
AVGRKPRKNIITGQRFLKRNLASGRGITFLSLQLCENGGLGPKAPKKYNYRTAISQEELGIRPRNYFSFSSTKELLFFFTFFRGRRPRKNVITGQRFPKRNLASDRGISFLSLQLCEKGGRGPKAPKKCNYRSAISREELGIRQGNYFPFPSNYRLRWLQKKTWSDVIATPGSAPSFCRFVTIRTYDKEAVGRTFLILVAKLAVPSGGCAA